MAESIRVLIPEKDVAARIEEMGRQISEDYAGEEVIVVCVLNGAMPFTADLLRKLEGQVRLDTIAASSYGNGTISSGTVKITKELKTDIVGRNVLLVDDVFDTGLTMSLLVETLQARGAKSIKSCVFLDKTARHSVVYRPDYVGYEIPDAFVIGYGLDYNEQYRQLPYVGIIKSEAIR